MLEKPDPAYETFKTLQHCKLSKDDQKIGVTFYTVCQGEKQKIGKIEKLWLFQ